MQSIAKVVRCPLHFEGMKRPIPNEGIIAGVFGFLEYGREDNAKISLWDKGRILNVDVVCSNLVVHITGLKG